MADGNGRISFGASHPSTNSRDDNQHDQDVARKKQQYSEDELQKMEDRGEDHEAAMEEGHLEAVKNDAQQTQEASNKLDELIDKTQPLIQISTVFPFQVFPTKISVDINKVSVVNKTFFSSGVIQGIPIKNISDVIVQAGLFFAKLSIHDRFFDQNSIHVDYLPKNEAMRVRRILQGIIVAYDQNIDFTKLTTEEIQTKIEELGASYERI